MAQLPCQCWEAWNTLRPETHKGQRQPKETNNVHFKWQKLEMKIISFKKKSCTATPERHYDLLRPAILFVLSLTQMIKKWREIPRTCTRTVPELYQDGDLWGLSRRCSSKSPRLNRRDPGEPHADRPLHHRWANHPGMAPAHNTRQFPTQGSFESFESFESMAVQNFWRLFLKAQVSIHAEEVLRWALKSTASLGPNTASYHFRSVQAVWVRDILHMTIHLWVGFDVWQANSRNSNFAANLSFISRWSMTMHDRLCCSMTAFAKLGIFCWLAFVVFVV